MGTERHNGTTCTYNDHYLLTLTTSEGACVAGGINTSFDVIVHIDWPVAWHGLEGWEFQLQKPIDNSILKHTPSENYCI